MSCLQVPRLQSVVRDRRANWEQSLATLRAAKAAGARITKTSIMLGCGESPPEVMAAMQELRDNGGSAASRLYYRPSVLPDPECAKSPIICASPVEWLSLRAHVLSRQAPSCSAGLHWTTLRKAESLKGLCIDCHKCHAFDSITFSPRDQLGMGVNIGMWLRRCGCCDPGSVHAPHKTAYACGRLCHA